MSDKTVETGWVKLYYPGEGAIQVTIPVPSDGTVISPETARAMRMSVGNLLAAGWLPNAAGVEQGEDVIDIEAAARREKENDDGTTTPVIDLYPPRWQFRVMGVYLNTTEDIDAFERATGLRLTDIPVYDGSSPIKLDGSEARKAGKYVVALPAPAKLVWKPNPRYEGPEDKRHQKRLFVRWYADNGGSPVSAPGSPAPAAGSEEHPGEFIVPAGMRRDHVGQPLKALSEQALRWYAFSFEPKTGSGLELQQAARAYVAKLSANVQVADGIPS